MNNNDREIFLLEFYKVCWNNITRAEDAAWKRMTAYATLIAGLSFVYSDIKATGFLIIIIIFSFFSISISLNANLWFVRNMGIISNLEKEFLNEGDYNVIIPKSYKGKIPFFSIHLQDWEAWWIHIIAYFAVCASFIWLLTPSISYTDKQLVKDFFVFGLIFTFIYGLFLSFRHEKFKRNAQGRQF